MTLERSKTVTNKRKLFVLKSLPYDFYRGLDTVILPIHQDWLHVIVSSEISINRSQDLTLLSGLY